MRRGRRRNEEGPANHGADRIYEDGRHKETPVGLRFKIFKDGVHLASSPTLGEAERMAEYLGGEIKRPRDMRARK